MLEVKQNSDTVDALIAVYHNLAAQEKQRKETKQQAETAETEVKQRLVSVNAANAQFTTEREAKTKEMFDEALVNLAADLSSMAEWGGKQERAADFTARLAAWITFEVLPGALLRRVEAEVALLRVRAKMADSMVAIAQRQFDDAIAPVVAVQGPVVSMAAPFPATTSLIEGLKGEAARAWKGYSGAVDALRDLKLKQSKDKAARESMGGTITRQQVGAAIARY